MKKRLVYRCMLINNPRPGGIRKRSAVAAIVRRAVRRHIPLSLLVLRSMGGRLHRRPFAVSSGRTAAVLLEQTRAERVLGGAAGEGVREAVRQLREPGRGQHDRCARRHDRWHPGVVRDQGDAHRGHEERDLADLGQVSHAQVAHWCFHCS